MRFMHLSAAIAAAAALLTACGRDPAPVTVSPGAPHAPQAVTVQPQAPAEYAQPQYQQPQYQQPQVVQAAPPAVIYQQAPAPQVIHQSDNGTNALLAGAAGVALGTMMANGNRQPDVVVRERTIVREVPSYAPSYSSTQRYQPQAAPVAPPPVARGVDVRPNFAPPPPATRTATGSVTAAMAPPPPTPRATVAAAPAPRPAVAPAPAPRPMTAPAPARAPTPPAPARSPSPPSPAKR